MSKREFVTKIASTFFVVAVLVFGVARFAVDDNSMAFLDSTFNLDRPQLVSATKQEVFHEVVKPEYKFLAYNGDSVISLSKFAIANYSVETGEILDGAESVYVSAKLAEDFSFKRLERGEEITSTKERLATLFESAKALSSAQKLVWARY